MEYKSFVYGIIVVLIEKIEFNDYNLNVVVLLEMQLLYKSIKEDGYIMLIVCYYNEEKDKYIIVDGFYRYRVMFENEDIYDRENGFFFVLVIDKFFDERMVSII